MVFLFFLLIDGTLIWLWLAMNTAEIKYASLFGNNRPRGAILDKDNIMKSHKVGFSGQPPEVTVGVSAYPWLLNESFSGHI